MNQKVETLITLRSQIQAAILDLVGTMELTPSDRESFMISSVEALRADLTAKAAKAALISSALAKLTIDEKSALFE